MATSVARGLVDKRPHPSGGTWAAAEKQPYSQDLGRRVSFTLRIRPLLIRRLGFFSCRRSKELKMGSPRPCVRLGCAVPRWRCVQTRIVKKQGSSPENLQLPFCENA